VEGFLLEYADRLWARCILSLIKATVDERLDWVRSEAVSEDGAGEAEFFCKELDLVEVHGGDERAGVCGCGCVLAGWYMVVCWRVFWLGGSGLERVRGIV
jgi:hypothetical protein